MAVDVLATQEARASTTMILTKLNFSTHGERITISGLNIIKFMTVSQNWSEKGWQVIVF